MNGLFALALCFISTEGTPNTIGQKIAWAPEVV